MNGGNGPDEEMISLMESILSNKSVYCDDIKSIGDARKELSRIRKLMANFQKQPMKHTVRKKDARNALHEQENINDYVKEVVHKDDGIRTLIYHAIKDNILFEANTEDELTEIVDIFEPCSFETCDVVIEQGQNGDEFFVVEKGELSIAVRMDAEDNEKDIVMARSVNEVKVGTYSDGSAFGELALIYRSPRAATITANDECKLWRIKRAWYRGVVGQHRQRLHKEKLEFLPAVKVGKYLFSDVFSRDQLDSIAQLLKQEYYKRGDTIVREGESGNTFYIIQTGTVDILKAGMNNDLPITSVGVKDFFGEKALLSDDVRAATVVASSDVVVCYVMTRGDFSRVLGNMKDILDGKVKQRSTRVSVLIQRKRVHYEMDQLETFKVLGIGAFGKVTLVKAKDTGDCYALKAQGKEFIIENGQKEYILNELRLMKLLEHPNIVNLQCSLQDKKFIYFLLDLLPGGELMDHLQKKGRFNEDETRFYCASVLLAYSAMHEKRIVYRDLKPENLCLDAKGYCIMVDLGLAKDLKDGPTYTFCGTPDYIAPEIIRGTGYGLSVDYWALGVLLFELTAGVAPFQSYDPTGTAKKILKGSVNFPPRFSNQIKEIVKVLLVKDSTRRLGCMRNGIEGVMKHRFFQGLNWEGLLNRNIDDEIPIKPKIPKKIESSGKSDNGGDNVKDSKWMPDLDAI